MHYGGLAKTDPIGHVKHASSPNDVAAKGVTSDGARTSRHIT